VGHSQEELRSVVGAYAAAGIHNVLVLRGDPPGGPGTPWTPTEGGLTYASELVALVRSLGSFSVGVAAFPEGHREAAGLEDDVRVLRAKQDAGAKFAITEMFFRESDYFGLLERARGAGVTMPILPGIMPITSLRQVTRMAELSGRDVPAEVVARVARHEGDPDAVRAAGIEVASELCDALLSGGAPGLHFYTLNRSKATREIYANLRLPVGARAG
jgi:methylenetetrahydrofolate reductase (NADPH)